MKKYLIPGAMCMLVVLLSGCQGMLVTHCGYASAPGGFLISDMKGATMIQQRHPARRFKVLGKVKAEAQTTSYLGLVSNGDASYQTLKRTALES